MRHIFLISFIFFIFCSASYAKTRPVPIPVFEGDLDRSIIQINQDYNEEFGYIPLPENPAQEALDDTSFLIVNQQDYNNQPHITAIIKTEKNSIFVKNIEVDGYELLTNEEIRKVTSKYEGKNLSKEELLQVVQDINNLYTNYNIITAKAFIPQQNLENNTLKVKIVEGKIENINVIGNKYTRTKYIKNALTQKEGDIIFIPEIRDELLKFNRNNDIKLKAYINKGPKFGTSDITIAVTEQKPYHVNLSFDNTGNELIGTIKEGITLQHDSLLGFRDKLTLSYDRTRSFNSYAGSYSAPIGYSGLRAGGLYNYSPLKITSGELKDLNIEGKTRNYSLFLTKPIFSTSNFSLSSTLSLNHKRSTTYIDGISLEDLLEIPSTIVNSTDLSFLAIKNDKWGQWVHSSDFALGTEMMDANSKFFKYTGSLTRFQDMGHNIQLLMRGNLQLTNNDLPSLEKFQAGGAYTVRGYSEGYLLGDNGYTVGSELRFPLFVLPEKIGNFAFRNRIQGLTFFDAGGAFQDNQQKNNIMGIGCGLRIRLSRYLFGRLDYGLGLINKAMDKSASRFYFGIESAPF